jgi:Protein of unknown function (DUF4236)
MRIGFRRTVKIAPGIRLNLGLKSVSISTGIRGLRYTTGTRGRRVTAGLPGTGLFWTSKLLPGRHSALKPLWLLLLAILIAVVWNAVRH